MNWLTWYLIGASVGLSVVGVSVILWRTAVKMEEVARLLLKGDSLSPAEIDRLRPVFERASHLLIESSLTVDDFMRGINRMCTATGKSIEP